METAITKESLIEKALLNEVTSENISTKLNMEEIVYLNRLKNVLNCFSIESTLCNYADRAEISEDYKKYLREISDREVLMQKNIDIVLKEAIENMPEAICKFVSIFLADILYNDYESVEKNYAEVLSSKECKDYINNLENKLHFEDAFYKTNVIQYVKKKYSAPVEYYYVDLINNIAFSDIFGLLYILYE